MVECPICGLKRKSLFKHIRTHGYSCKEDFLKDYPDFYIKSLDTYLEVKSTFYYNKDKYLNDLKLKTLRINGYNIKLIREKELENLDSFKQALYGCADT